ncbi:CHAP domain-containing protein [Kitasatospora sp. NPDC004289]
MSSKLVQRALATSVALLSTVPAVVFLGAPTASASVSSSIVNTARANLGDGACSTNSSGTTGFYTSCSGGPEAWCADFAKWVWAQNGVNVAGLTNGAGSFANYNGGLKPTPHVGDAVVYEYNGVDWAAHVAIVASVGNGTITTIGGNEGSGGRGPSYSSVRESAPFNSTVGTSGHGQRISGYVSPIGGNDSTPPPAVVLPVNVQLGIVGAQGSFYNQYGNYAAGRFNPNWTDVGGTSLTKVTSVTVGDVTHFYAVANGRVYGRDLYPGASWSNWGEIPGGATGVRDLTASVSGNNVILGIAGGDGSFFTQFGNYDLGHFDPSWVKREGSGLTNITSVTSGDGDTIRFYGVAGGRVFGSDFTLNTNSTASWSEIPGGATDVRDIAATQTGNNVILAVAGYGGSFHTQYGNFDQGHFDAAWTQRAGSAIDNVAATTTPDGKTVHFYGLAQGRAYGADFTLNTNAVSNWSEIPGGALGAKDITASQAK